MTTSEIPNAPIPDHAIDVGDWGLDTTGQRSRWLLWSSFGDGDVAVDGRQHPDGTVDAAVSVWVGDGAQLDVAQARQLAANLVNAAEALDELFHQFPPAA